MDTIPYWCIKEIPNWYLISFNIFSFQCVIQQELFHQIEFDGWFQIQKLGKSSYFFLNVSGNLAGN